VLRNFTGRNADQFRVFALETLYRRRGDVRGGPGGPHHTVAWSRGAPPYGVATPWPLSGSPSDFIPCREK
jgi:hypothetical protein